jgi:hypothetical protein
MALFPARAEKGPGASYVFEAIFLTLFADRDLRRFFVVLGVPGVLRGGSGADLGSVLGAFF